MTLNRFPVFAFVVSMLILISACGDSGYIGDSEDAAETDGDNAVDTAEGSFLFNQNCAGCHGEDAKGSMGRPDIRGKTAAQIKSALAAVPMMSFLSFSDGEIEQIASYLKTLIPVSGKATAFKPLWAKITIKDSQGKRVSTTSDPVTGEYHVDHTGLVPPLLAQAKEKWGEEELYGIAFELGHLSITPLTDQLLRSAVSGITPGDFFDSCRMNEDCFQGIKIDYLDHAYKNLRKNLSPEFEKHAPDAALETLLNEPIGVSGIADLLTAQPQRGLIENCDNPENRHGFLFDNDFNADCYPDFPLMGEQQ